MWMKKKTMTRQRKKSGKSEEERKIIKNQEVIKVRSIK